MYLYNNSKIIYFSENNLNDEDRYILYIPDSYQKLLSQITKYQGEYYYYKPVNTREMINELIGSALAQKIGLDTVDYKIGKTGLNSVFLYALSKVFFEKGFNYNNCYDTYESTNEYRLINSYSFFSYIYLYNSDLLERVENYNTILNVLKLTALDLKMGQFDRHNGNILLKIDRNGQICLAPMFDYGGSYLYASGTKIYDNPFLMIRKNKLSLFQFKSKFPEIREYASLLESIPIDEVLDDIQIKHMIEFEDRERNYYQKHDVQNNKVLRKIMR